MDLFSRPRGPVNPLSITVTPRQTSLNVAIFRKTASFRAYKQHLPVKLPIKIVKQNLESLRLLHLSQKKHFPYEMKAHGLRIQIDQGVFPPSYFTGWRFFHKHLARCKGKKVLEMGCGTGIASLCMAKNGAKSILAVDVSHAAVRNTKRNAKLNLITTIKARRSNLFSSIKDTETFDIIYWNFPFLQQPRNYKYKNILEKSLFDPGYQMLGLFLGAAKFHLTQKGTILLGWGEYADTRSLKRIANKFGYGITLFASDKSSEMRFDFYSLHRDSENI